MPHVHARRECRFDLAHERPEIDALLGGEIHRELLAIELPLDVRDFHVEVKRTHHINRLSTHGFFIRPQLSGARDFNRVRCTKRGRRLARRGFAVGGAALAHLGRVARGTDATEVFAPLHVDDDRRFERRGFVEWPEEEIAAVAFKLDFDQLRHTLMAGVVIPRTAPCAGTSRGGVGRACRA